MANGPQKFQYGRLEKLMTEIAFFEFDTIVI